MRGERSAIVLCLALFAVLLVAFVVGWWSAPPSPQERLTQTAGVEMFAGGQVGDLSFINEYGDAVSLADLKGRWSLLFFGYTYCPDVCPTALQKMGALQQSLGKDGKAVKYIFISVDTERDTPETMAPYVTSRGFPQPLIGLSGTADQIDTAVSAYRVYAQKVADPTSAAEFTYDHSDLIILMNSDGEFEDIFTRDDSLPKMAGRVKLLLNQEG
mgnify:CR=1 FL=1